jgi:glucose/arabinose dehydrogenase
VAAVLAAAWLAAAAGAERLPGGFRDERIAAGMHSPTSVAFAPDGRVFVAEQRGTILGLHDRRDREPRRVGDLRREVHSFGERGLMSVAVDPAFPRRPFIYVAYTLNAPPGQEAPYWPSPPSGDRCFGGKPDKGYKRGCPVMSRVSQLRIGKRGKVRDERVLIQGWCQVFSSHSAGDLAFDRTGALLVSGGDGAYYDGPDIGQRGRPANACGDPPGEGGALRAQDLRTLADPVSLDGTVARIDPDTGLAAPGNPLPGATGWGRVIAYGFRNPFRFAVRPGTDEVWVADVGWITAEEVDLAHTDRLTDFGWPCYEGKIVQPRYAKLHAPICESLYADPDAVRGPFLSYRHGNHVAAGEDCPASDAAAISGVAFDEGRRFPWPLDGALLFADYVRGCIWAVPPGRFGRPRHGAVRVLESGAVSPIDLESGPGGLYYVDIAEGSLRRISYARPTSEIRLRTRPAGFRLAFDERVERDGTAVTVRRGTAHRVIAPRRQQLAGRVFRFRRWRGAGGSRSLTLRPHGSAVTATAVYRCTRHCGGD